MTDEIFAPDHPLRVLPISSGCALGPVRLLDHGETEFAPVHISADQLASERQLLQRVLAAVEVELDALSAQVAGTVGQAEAGIFQAQKMMVRDPDLLDLVDDAMTTQLLSAASAWQMVVEQQSAELAALPDATLAARAVDVRDMGARVLRQLVTPGTAGSDEHGLSSREPSIIVARDLTPSQTAQLDPASILGICTVEGGPTTHAAIIARALEIPAVAGLDARILADLHVGQMLGIDGGRGLLYLQPDEAQRAELITAMAGQQSRKDARNSAGWRTRPGETGDGRRVLVYANVGDTTGAREAARQGAQGIGLLRTEFLFGQRTTFPDEQEQFEQYLELFQAFADQALFDKTIVARTLDAGADKPFPALEPLLGSWKEANPALGLRGARIHLLHEELLRQQVRALLRAAGSAAIDLHIMFPMIATLEETRRLKQVVADLRDSLRREGIVQPQDVAVGIMIETPSAVWLADALAREVDFLSIGANDLFQYTLAADRTNSRVMGLFGSLEPALWRSINHVLQAARIYECPVAVCGEIAADTRYGPLLAGLGIEELSVSPPALARVKEALFQHPFSFWQSRAQALLQAESAAEVAGLVADL